MYKLGAAKIIEAGGIKFHVKTPAKAFSEWEQATREFLGELGADGVPDDATRKALQEKEQELQQRAYAFVVGWEDVTDEDGNPVLFSQERLLEVDAAIVQELYAHLSDTGLQVGQAIAEGNAG